MTRDTRGSSSAEQPEDRDRTVSDPYLVRATLGGDPAALRALISRYDRLIRYAIFERARQRCRTDPQWLDAVASATWAGFVQSINRSPDQLPDSVPGYLVRIARNQVISHLRRQNQPHDSLDALGNDTIEAVDTDSDPLAVVGAAEDLAALRACLEHVGGPDGELLAHLEAITERRWKDAAAALETPESTLRSRWQRLLGRLRDCVEGKTGKSFAPRDPDGD